MKDFAAHMRRFGRALRRRFGAPTRSLLARYGWGIPFLAGFALAVLLAWGIPHLSQIRNPFTQSYPEVQALSATHWNFQQYADYFQKLADKKGAVYAYAVLARASFPQGIDVHLLGHIVGDMLYTQKGIDAIKYCTPEFRNACSHSVVIGILSEHGEGSLATMSTMCKQAPGGKGAYGMCFHGLGHGVLAYTGYDLKRAVAMCKEVGTPEYHDREYIECVGGTIMEMIAGVHDRAAWEKQVGTYFKASDPLYPCDADFMPVEVRPICYVQLTPHLFTSAGGSLNTLDPATFPKAFSFCRAIPDSEPQLRTACYSGFGKEFVVIAKDRDIRNIDTADDATLRKVHAWCAMANDAGGETACDGSALASLYWGGENEPDAAVRFCAVAEGTPQKACYEQLATDISFYGTDAKETKRRCDLLPESYRPRCLAAPPS